MDGVVNFYEDQVGWYHAYNDDALVVAHVLGYQLYERNGHEHAIGFPIEVLKKVAKYLSYYNIGYNINNINIIEYPNSQYDECLKNDFHRKYVCDDLPIKRSKKEVIRGKFVIQYNDEELLEKEIGVNINGEAPIVKFVAENDIGTYNYANEIVKIISKNIEIDEIDVLF